jgi:hypothetical protein
LEARRLCRLKRRRSKLDVALLCESRGRRRRRRRRRKVYSKMTQ